VVPARGGRGVRARAERHRGRAPPSRRRAHARASVASARAHGGRARQPALLRRLGHRGGHPRAVAARAREARVEGPGLARGAPPLAAARVLAPRDRGEQPRPPSPLLDPRLPPTRLHPSTRAASGRYVSWAWLCEGGAVWLSGQTPYLRAAMVRRLREGGRP